MTDSYDPGVGTAEDWARAFPLAKASPVLTPAPPTAAALAVGTTGLRDLIAQVQGGPQGTLGPGAPMAPFHQDEGEPRRWDYRPGWNTQISPRAGEDVSFAVLRALGRNYDIASLARQKRVDGIKALDWSIRPIPIKGLNRSEAKDRAVRLEEQVAEATSFWLTPNGEDTYNVWINQYLTDLWETDSATIYLRGNRGGGLYGLEVPDGTTIRPIIDVYGRIPKPPLPGYAQVIMGVTWTMFGSDEIIYQPYWQTTDSPYGHPPTEWLLLAINRALRRQTLDLSNFTEGTLPIAFLRVAADTPAGDIKDLKQWLDSMLAGNDVARSRVIPVPGGAGTGLDRVHEQPSTEAEEWLMHITCAAHGVIPSELGFISKGASALGGSGMAKRGEDVTVAREKALARHLAGIWSGITQGPGGWPELEFYYEGLDTEEDSLQMAQTQQIFVNMGALSVDEVREDTLDKDGIGLPQYVMTTQGPVLVTDIIAPPAQELPVAGGLPQPTEPVVSSGVEDPNPEGEGHGTRTAAPSSVPGAKAVQEPTKQDELGKVSGDLARWRRKSLRAYALGRSPDVAFETNEVEPAHVALVRSRLAKAHSPTEVAEAFTLRKAGAPARPLPDPRPSGSSGLSPVPRSTNRGSLSYGTWASRAARPMLHVKQ